MWRNLTEFENCMNLIRRFEAQTTETVSAFIVPKKSKNRSRKNLPTATTIADTAFKRSKRRSRKQQSP